MTAPLGEPVHDESALSEAVARVRTAVEHSGVRFVLQAEQRGTGHAMQMLKAFFTLNEAPLPKHLLVLSGDVPLIRPETIAAMIVEPVMGAGGAIVPPEGYFDAITRVLDRYDIALIDDEVITLGKTPKLVYRTEEELEDQSKKDDSAESA